MPDVSHGFALDHLLPRNRAERRQAAHQAKRREKNEFPHYMRRQVASEYFWEVWGQAVSSNTLAKLAVTGGGPVYHKVGRFPTYSQPDCDDYAIRRLGPALRSTSEIA
jgi:hypothetical protein